ncbi:MAG: helix-turn-helix domain-containing protein [Candidatus Jordarchaeum sp.]|uniref:helix-turn-helix domain-containing protein n=1 Tax=Candidatus Jordarchaeum sp. TaxID=2823881 RepID=UPI00404AB5CA
MSSRIGNTVLRLRGGSLKVLSLLSISHRPLRPVEIAEILGMPLNDVGKYLVRLGSKGLVSKVDMEGNSTGYVSNLDILEMLLDHERRLRELE